MEVRTNGRVGWDYILYHVLLASAYICLLVLPGLLLPRYWAFSSTLVFATVLFLSLRSYVLALFSLRKAPLDPELPEQLPTVSIIIPSYNEESVLPRTIPTALGLDYPPDKLELIYVYESACSDRTEEIIRRFAEQDPRIKPIRRATIKGGKAAATNFGLKFATGDIIGSFDADHSLNSDLVRLAVSHFQGEDVACVRGRCRAINRTQSVISRLAAIERDMVERLGTYGASRMGGFANMCGGHGFVRRDILDRFGPFDEDILTEDIDLSVKLHLAGYLIRIVPRMQSWEESPTTMQPLIQQRRRWARGWMQVWRNYIVSILYAPRVPLMRRCDVLVSLTSSVISGLLIAVVPFIMLSAFGVKTSFFSDQTAFILWLFVTTAPVVSAGLAWMLDRAEPEPPPLSDLLYAPLLVPYIVFFFGISWLCLIDEFVLSWPFAYVKTARADEEYTRATPARVYPLVGGAEARKGNGVALREIDASTTRTVRLPIASDDVGSYL